MKTLKLKKGLSYTIKGVTLKKGKETTVEDSIAEKLLKTGRFEEIAAVTEADSSDDKEASDDASTDKNDAASNEEEVTVVSLEKMSKADLTALAEEKGIDISGCTNNAQRVAKIAEALGLAVSE